MGHPTSSRNGVVFATGSRTPPLAGAGGEDHAENADFDFWHRGALALITRGGHTPHAGSPDIFENKSEQ